MRVDYPDELRRFADELHMAAFGHESDDRIALLRGAADEIERLTPGPMTTAHAVRLMNGIAYNGADDWEEDEDGLGHVRSRSLREGIGTWTAAAIGRQVEREQETAGKLPRSGGLPPAQDLPQEED